MSAGSSTGRVPSVGRRRVTFRPASQRPSVGDQLPGSPPSGLAPRPTPPIANAPPPSGAGAPPRPSHPIAGVPPQRPEGPGTTPPLATRRRPVGSKPPGYYPPYASAPIGRPIPATGRRLTVHDDGYYGPTGSVAPLRSTRSSIPCRADCREVGVTGTTYRLCGSTWYAPRFSGNQLVYVAVAPPT